MKTSLLKGTLYLTISSLIFMISGYTINIWLGRHLGPELYGVYGIIISLVTVINLTQTAGLPQAISKYVSSDTDKAESIYKIGLFLQILSTCIIAILFFLFSGTIATLLKDPKLTPYLQLSSLIFPLYGVFALLSGYYNGLHYFGKQAMMHIIYSVVKIIAIIGLTVFLGLKGVVLGFIISPLIALFLGFHFPISSGPAFPYKKLIYFSLPLICVAIFANLLQSIDLFFVKALLHSDNSTGFYTANQNIAEIPYFALTALASVLFPSISKSVSLNLHGETKNLITKSLRFCLLLLTPGVLLISATSNDILSLLFSAEYQLGGSSLSILVIGSGFFTLFMILSIIISSSGSPLKSAVLSGVGVILASCLCFFLVPSYGLIGAASSTTIASFIMMIAASVTVYKKFGVLFSTKSVIKIFLSSILIYLIAKFVVVPLIFLPLFYIFILLFYIFILILLKEVDMDDLNIIKSLFPIWLIKRLKI